MTVYLLFTSSEKFIYCGVEQFKKSLVDDISLNYLIIESNWKAFELNAFKLIIGAIYLKYSIDSN
jgi:hypothetical protein